MSCGLQSKLKAASEAETEDTDSDDENTQSEEGRLQQKEKEDIRVQSLGDPPVQDTTSGEASEQECSEQSHGEQNPDSTTNDVLGDLRQTLSRSDVGSLQYR